jgi:hypothetical protein
MSEGTDPAGSPPEFCLTEVVLLDNINRVEIRFTQAARKHRIGRASARHVMATSTPTAMMTGQGNAAWLYIGLDESDRELEVIAVEIWPDQDPPYLLVIHVMPTSLRR